MVLAALD